MKQYSLDAHVQDIEKYFHDRGNYYADRQMMWFTAYERWLNDRLLLTVEDEYVFKYQEWQEEGERCICPNWHPIAGQHHFMWCPWSKK